MNFTNMQNMQNMQNIPNIQQNKINRKRKYDNFCGNFVINTPSSTTQRIIRENKRLKIEVINLNQRISLLEIQLQNLSLVVKEGGKAASSSSTSLFELARNSRNKASVMPPSLT